MAEHEETALLVCSREWSKQNLLTNLAIYHASALLHLASTCHKTWSLYFGKVNVSWFICAKLGGCNFTNLVPLGGSISVASLFPAVCLATSLPHAPFVTFPRVNNTFEASVLLWIWQYAQAQSLSQINDHCWHCDGSSVADVLVNFYKEVLRCFVEHSSTEKKAMPPGAFLCSILSRVSKVRVSRGRRIVLEFSGFRWWSETQINL